jgi:hypothetical protein
MFGFKAKQSVVCDHCATQIDESGLDYRAMSLRMKHNASLVKAKKRDEWAGKYGLYIAVLTFPLIMFVGLLPKVALTLLTGFVVGAILIALIWLMFPGLTRLGWLLMSLIDPYLKGKTYKQFCSENDERARTMLWFIGAFLVGVFPLLYFLGKFALTTLHNP